MCLIFDKKNKAKIKVNNSREFSKRVRGKNHVLFKDTEIRNNVARPGDFTWFGENRHDVHRSGREG